MATLHTKLNSGPSDHQHFDLKQKDGHAILIFPDDGTELGYLRSGEGNTLLRVHATAGVVLEILARKSILCEVISRATKPAEAMVKVDVGVRGPRREASSTGDKLSRGSLWLQEPEPSYGIDTNFYENPHFLQLKIKTGAIKQAVLAERGVNNENAARKRKREEQLRRMVEEVYKSVENSRHLDRVEGGERVSRQLLGYGIVLITMVHA